MQVILQAEEGLKELDAGINELKKRIDKIQIDQPSAQELSKIQVWFISSILDPSYHLSHLWYQKSASFYCS